MSNISFTRSPAAITALLLVSSMLVSACDSTEPADTTFTFDFNRGPQGFVAGFADYPPARSPDFDLVSDHRALPAPLESRSGLFIAGTNRSADLFMFFKGPIDGLPPGQYEATVSLEIATDTPAGCFGIGGPPGESVTVKAGATDVEPLAVVEDSYLRMNIDVGNQANSGSKAVAFGDIANSRQCEESWQWELKSFEAQPIPSKVSVSSDGRAWILIGTDSGFAGRTGIYFTRVSVSFAPI
ncbi:MAG: hypothetical protein OXL34_16350 [Gemmatimonadota bacterium]|nr:hypothetical protein [Gemmatimonadota bacterium]